MRAEPPVDVSLNVQQRLRPWLDLWGLLASGKPLATHSSILLPVLVGEKMAMLKVALIAEEARGARQLAWWDGSGTAKVLRIEGDAVLIEHATGGSLAPMARAGRDEEAISIICRVASQLHRPLGEHAPDLVPLDTWFEPLLAASEPYPDFALAAAMAQRLLAGENPQVSLHGDLHHHNVLDFGGGDWRAIDPKGLRGERTFDFVHLLRNPDVITAGAHGRLEARVTQIGAEANLNAERLLAWTVAFAGLSAIWLIEEGVCPDADLELLRRANDLLGASEP